MRADASDQHAREQRAQRSRAEDAEDVEGEQRGALALRRVDVEARALMLPGLVSWLVKDDVPSDPAQQQQIAREIANLVAVGLARVS